MAEEYDYGCYAGTCVYIYDSDQFRFQLAIVDGEQCDPAFPAATCAESILARGYMVDAMTDLNGTFPEYRMVVCCRSAASWPASVGS